MNIKQLNEELDKFLIEELNLKDYKIVNLKKYDYDDLKKYAKTFKFISARKKDFFNHFKNILFITKLDNGHYCFWNEYSTHMIEAESLADIKKYHDEFDSWGFEHPKYEPELDDSVFNVVCPSKKNKKLSSN